MLQRQCNEKNPDVEDNIPKATIKLSYKNWYSQLSTEILFTIKELETIIIIAFKKDQKAAISGRVLNTKT
jgi:predicted DNA-binding ArsR family transcriptional regulator